MCRMLEVERTFFESHLQEYLERYPGKYVVIKATELVGVYDRIEDALTEATRLFGLDSYLVRQIVPVQAEVSVPALTLGILGADPSHTIRG